MAVTPRSRDESRALLEEANAARAARQAARRASSLRRDFTEEREWRKLAKVRNVRLPPWGQPPTPALMRRWLKRVGISTKDYLDCQGEGPLDPRTNRNRRPTLRDFAARNPDWPLRAWAGLLLEAFPVAAEKVAVPKVGDVVLIRWGQVRNKWGDLVPRCDRWAMGRIEEVEDAAVAMRVTVINEGEHEDKASSAGCVKGCTPACHDPDGLPGGALVWIRRDGLTWSRQPDPEAFRWLVWDDAVEAVQGLPEDTTAA
jgi:hypothetical protein